MNPEENWVQNDFNTSNFIGFLKTVCPDGFCQEDIQSCRNLDMGIDKLDAYLDHFSECPTCPIWAGNHVSEIMFMVNIRDLILYFSDSQKSMEDLQRAYPKLVEAILGEKHPLIKNILDLMK